MKTLKLTSVICMLLFATCIFAQQQQGKDNIESLHTAFITEKLNLSQDEAEKFWPVFNQYYNDFEALKKQRSDNKEAVKKAGGIDNMSDADVQKMIANETDIESRGLELRKQYIAKFEQVLSVKKVAKFYVAEEEFKVYLLKQLGNRRRGMNRGASGDFVPQ